MRYHVGDELLHDCGRCKMRTHHVVFAMDGQRVLRVQCKLCQSYHNYRGEAAEARDVGDQTPDIRRRRSGAEGDAQTPPSKQSPTPSLGSQPSTSRAPRPPSPKRSSSRASSSGGEKLTNEEKFDQAMAGREPTSARPYTVSQEFTQDTLIYHSSFGIGIVLLVMPAQEKKMHVLFRDGQRTLKCGLSLPPAP